jgi:N,N'-diacetyllegionaminate synthase
VVAENPSRRHKTEEKVTAQGQIQLVAEIGNAHDGSLGMAHAYIDAAAECGVDAVKFQTHIAEAESSAFEPFRVKFSYEDATRYDYWKRMEFSPEQWAGLKQHCEEKGVEFISSPFSNAAVDLLETIGARRYKIGSGEVSNFLMLEKIARTGKPILLSSGMSSLSEIDQTLAFLKPFGNPLTLLQCTTAYPTLPAQWGLNIIPILRERYGLPVGFSDHSGEVFACLAAAALGASVLEFHIVFDKKMFGPDTPASLDLAQAETLVRGIRQIETALSQPIDKQDNSAFQTLKSMFEKSLAVNKDLPEGHLLKVEDLEAKKPKGHGIAASQFREVLGKKLARPRARYDFLRQEDLQ